MAGRYKYMVQGGCKSMALHEYKCIMLCNHKLIVPCKRKCVVSVSLLSYLFSIAYDKHSEPVRCLALCAGAGSVEEEVALSGIAG
jgi:hypothetical protein